MLLLKEISAKRFLLAIVLAIMMTGFSYLAALANDQGALVWLFYTFRFPTHTLFWDFFKQSSTLYRTGLVINIFFWALVFERIIMFLRYLNKGQIVL